MDKVLVRVTMFDHPIEVDEDEIPGLRQQGLLVEDPEAELQRARDRAAAELARLDAELNLPADTPPARKAAAKKPEES